MRSVRIRGYNSEGVVVADYTFDVEPNHYRGFSLAESAGVVFCKFTFIGNAADFRAAIQVLDGGGDGIITSMEAH